MEFWGMGKNPVQSREGISRRQFLAASGWLALGTTTLASPLISEAARFNRDLFRVTTGRTGMGTFVNMIVFHSSRDKAQEAIEKAYQEIDRLVGILSCYDGATPVSFLNREGRLGDLPPELAEVLNSSLQFHKISNGSFDITIKPVVDLYKKSFQDTGKPPEEAQLRTILARVGSGFLDVEKSRVLFRKEGMSITLDGIAKGYIVDRAMDVFRSEGVQHGLINAGGDIAVTGLRGDGKPWNIAIQDPWNPNKIVDTIKLAHGAVATSGNYEVYFDHEKQYHHLITPVQGSPANEEASVSIIAPNTMIADALSTTVFVLGAGKGRAVLKSIPQTGGLILSQKHRPVAVNWGNRV